MTGVADRPQPPPFSALDLDFEDANRPVISALCWAGPGQVTVHQWLVGGDATAARGHARARPGVDVQAVPSLSQVAAALLELGDEQPWVTFDQAARLAAWAAEDTTGALAVTPLLDAGELAVLVLGHVRGTSLEELLAQVEALAGAPAPAWPAEYAPLGRAAAVATLWLTLPAALAQRPYALRAEIDALLTRARSPLAPVWRAAVPPEAPAGEPTLLEAWLRLRLAQLTPEQAPPTTPPAPRPIDPAQTAAHFAADGPLAAGFARYEPRAGQVALAEAVATALSGGQLLLAEAGTGTGKSLAYLLPAAQFALQNQTPVVISTATRNLQDQLLDQDLPRVEQALGRRVDAVRVKGRSNYLCVEKLLDEYIDAGLLPLDDTVPALTYLLSWAAATETGDLDEISGYASARWPELTPLSRKVASDSDACTATGRRGHPCFATVARRRAFEADLLIVNHALTLTNTLVPVLPAFEYAVFDEAHNLEDVATDTFGLDLERRALQSAAREAGLGGDQRSWLARLRKALGEQSEEAIAPVQAALLVLTGAAQKVIEAIDDLGLHVVELATRPPDAGPGPRRRPDAPSAHRRLQGEVWSQPWAAGAHAALGQLQTRATELQAALGGVLLALQGVRANGVLLSAEAGENAELRCQALQSDWAGLAAAMGTIMALDNERFVYWAQASQRRDIWYWRLRAAPIEPSLELEERLWSKLAAAVLTSATLTVDGNFDFNARRLGLRLPSTEPRYAELELPSPFNYRDALLFCVPTNIGHPRDDDFGRQVSAGLRELVLQLRGRTLALFTSRKMLLETYERVYGPLQAAGVEVLCQGLSGTRHQLAARFRRTERALLMGARSFWEGLDVPGEALSCVVIDRLPFRPPDDPVQAARCEQVKTQGGSDWAQYTLPQTILAFKQGLGRLIRTDLDRGAVVCFDRRLIDSNYGRAFLRSLPGYTSVIDGWDEIRLQIGDWLARPPADASGARRAP